MTTRHSSVRFLSLAISATLAGTVMVLPRAVFADDAPAISTEAVQQPFTGVVNDDNVYIRSGPGDIFYATTKLNKGDKVTVVATRKDWLKILPPEGSFCYVARAYVEKRGDGTVGRVTKPDLNVRAGSSLNGLKTTVQTSLAEGDDVKILADQAQDEYFKIAPPPGAFLYVQKSFVDAAPEVAAAPAPIPAAVVAAAKQTGADPIASEPVPPVVTPPVTPPTVTPPAVTPLVSSTPAAESPAAPMLAGAAATTGPTVAGVAAITGPTVAGAAATTGPTVAGAAATTSPTVASSVAPEPTTQPAEPTADEKFDTIEAAFLDATNQPLDQQPIDDLVTRYTALSSDVSLPSSMKRIVDMRIATLKLRGDAQKQYAEALKMQSDAKARQVALKAENDELADRVKQQAVSIYTALGTLRISSLQQTGTTMYRLADPTSGRTLVYIKSNDPKYSGLLNQFIGVKGDIVEDTNMNLKIIEPTAADQVDPTKVNTTVTATVIPPSLLPRTQTASVIGN